MDSGRAQIDITSGDGTHTAKYMLTVTRQERSYRLPQYQYLDSKVGDKGRTWGYVRVLGLGWGYVRVSYFACVARVRCVAHVRRVGGCRVAPNLLSSDALLRAGEVQRYGRVSRPAHPPWRTQTHRAAQPPSLFDAMHIMYVRCARSELAQKAKAPVPVVRAHVAQGKKEKRKQEANAEESYSGLQSTGYHAYRDFLVEKAKKELHRKGLRSKDEDAIRYLSSKEMMERATQGDIIDTHRLGPNTGKTPEARPSRAGLWDKHVPPSA